MTRLVFFLITSLFLRVEVLCEFLSQDNRVRTKRSLIFPQGFSRVQAIMGAGFPVDLQDESVIVGIVIKAYYLVPRNSSDYTNPNIFYARKKRDGKTATAASVSRWDVYKVLEQYASSYGLGGKECLLRTICELSALPIDKSKGIMNEILHVLFTPKSTNELVHDHSDNDYYAAQILGQQKPPQCFKHYSDCLKSYVDLFTI